MKCEVYETTRAAATQPPQASTGGQHVSPFTHSSAVTAFVRLVLWISFIFEICFYYDYVHGCVCVCGATCAHEHRFPWSLDMDIWFPGERVTGHRHLSNLVAGN